MQIASSPMQSILRLSLAAILFLNILAVCAAAQADSKISTKRAPSEAHVLYAPLPGMQGSEEWDLVLLNRGLIATDVAITFHSSDGGSYPQKKISLALKETRHIDVRTLLPPEAVEETLGGMVLECYGPPRTISAHVTIEGFHGLWNLDVPLVESQDFRSTTLAAVWWEPASAHSYLVLGNSWNKTVHVDLVFSSGTKQHIDLTPFSTRLLPFLYGSSQNTLPEGRVSSVQITYSGAPGTLRAAGFSTSTSEDFFDVLRFIDPKLSTEPILYAGGIHFGSVSSHLLVKNIGDAPITVSGRIYPLDRTQSNRPLALLSRSLAAGESGELQLPQPGLLQTLDDASVRLESSGGAASMIAVFTSIEPTHHMVRSVAFRDTRAYSALTGGYHWRIDDDYTSTVSITNIGKSRAAIAGFVRPNGEKEYKLDTKYLEAGESAVFDIRQIRDEQIPDPKGVKLPKNATTGQFDWSSILGDGSERLMGRAEVSSLSRRISIPLTDTNCDCPLSFISAFVDPGTPIIPVGGETSAATEVEYENICEGGDSIDPFDALDWTIQNPSILSLTTGTSNSTVKGLAAGKSNFNTSFVGEVYHFEPNGPDEGCTRTQEDVTPEGTGTVQVPTYFGPTGYQPVSCDCESGQVGTACIEVDDQVLDQNGNPMQATGITPQELVCVAGSCQSGYKTFSTPATTAGTGTFLDTPIGTCFSSPQPKNICLNATQQFQALYNGQTYPVTTLTTRQDCVQGVQDQIYGNPSGYNQTYKYGTLP